MRLAGKCPRSRAILGAKLIALAAALSAFAPLSAAHDSVAHYLANEGLMVVHGDTKVMFDPLFRQSYNNYRLVPEDMKAALLAGDAPYDGLDAIFISHYHGDHFTPEDMRAFMRARTEVALYAPTQAVDALRAIAASSDQAMFDRVHGVNLEYKDAPIVLEVDNLLIEAVRIPHSGWPTGRLDVANIAWRVTLDAATTIVHLGDADANDVHFALNPAFWQRNRPNMAFPPYWFFASENGLSVLKNRIKADTNVGIHVPTAVPQNPDLRPRELRGADLFTLPGETRDVGSHRQER